MNTQLLPKWLEKPMLDERATNNFTLLVDKLMAAEKLEYRKRLHQAGLYAIWRNS